MSIQTDNSTTVMMVNCTLNCSTTASRQSSGSGGNDNTIYILTTVIIAVGMVGIGATVYYKTLWEYIKKPKAFLLGVFMQLIIMPPLSWALTKIFQMPQAEALGVFIQGSCPGGTTSNIVVYWMDGIVDLSVAMTGTSTLLALGTMPLWLLIYQKGENLPHNLSIPFDRLAISLAALVIPIFVGMVIRANLAKYANIISKVFIALASIFILIMVIVNSVVSKIPWVVTWRQVVLAAIMPLIAYLIGYLVPFFPGLKLTHKAGRTISVETALQNAQIAAAVIQISFGKSRIIIAMLLFPLLYYVFQVGYSAIFAGIFITAKRRGWIKEDKEEQEEPANAGKAAAVEKSGEVRKTAVEKTKKDGIENPNFTKENDVAV
ncbi:unnamed protein product [Clavelina lepadiformis]|uniref:Ileal sodium/bile acid cotransporter n=1 Tax=Clavelina lepadiformis TaxID=159417 RepID=A0ABP0GIR0_CLALP